MKIRAKSGYISSILVRLRRDRESSKQLTCLRNATDGCDDQSAGGVRNVTRPNSSQENNIRVGS